MRSFLTGLVVNMLSIVITSYLLPGIYIEGGSFVNLLIVALVFGIINAILRPIFMLLSLPFIVVTLGLFIFVINALLFMFVANITPLVVDGFWWAVLGALVMGIVNSFLWRFVRDETSNTASTR